MRYYYIPLSSRNYTFENIFSTESISPESFYPIRKFGFNNFSSLPGYSDSNTLLLFTQPPWFTSGSPGEQDFIFLLAILASELDAKALHSISSNVVAYSRTIYLNRSNCKLLFFSERDMKLAQFKGATSLPTKPLGKYEKCIQIVSSKELVEIRKVDKVNFVIEEKNSLESYVEYDRHINYFKGFVYGIVGGVFNRLSPIEADFKKNLQKLINSISELRNKLENQSFESVRHQRSSGVKVNNLEILERRINEEMNFLDQQLMAMFPDEKVASSEILELFFKLFKKDFYSIDEAEKHIRSIVVNDKIFGTSHYQKLKNYVLINTSLDRRLVFMSNLRSALQGFLQNSKLEGESAKVKKNNCYESFKDGIFEISEWFSGKLKESRPPFEHSIRTIKYLSSKRQIEIESGFLSRTDKELTDFVMIANILFQNPKQNSREASKGELIEIVRQVESVFSNGKETQLSKYLNNLVNNYSIEKANSTVFRNFVAFVFNPDSLEKLEEFLQAKSIEESWMAYAFWCTYNGFARVSQNFLQGVFQKNNEKLQNEIDEYIIQLFQFSLEINNGSIPKLSEPVEIYNGFYKRVIEGKFSIPAKEINDLFKLNEVSEIIEHLKKRYGINKREGKKIATSLLDYKKTGSLF